MRLSKIKTDKSDTKMIRLYAQSVALKLWEGQSKSHIECLQITRLLSLYFKQTTTLKNKIHGEEVLGNPSLLVVRSLEKFKTNTKRDKIFGRKTDSNSKIRPSGIIIEIRKHTWFR